MKELNKSDYLILQRLIGSDGTGISKLSGKTKAEIMELTNLGKTKIYHSIKLLLEYEMIGLGVKKGSSKTYYILEKGVNSLKEVKTPVININRKK